MIDDPLLDRVAQVLSNALGWRLKKAYQLRFRAQHALGANEKGHTTDRKTKSEFTEGKIEFELDPAKYKNKTLVSGHAELEAPEIWESLHAVLGEGKAKDGKVLLCTEPAVRVQVSYLDGGPKMKGTATVHFAVPEQAKEMWA